MGVENTHKKDMGVTKEVGLDFFFCAQARWVVEVGKEARELYAYTYTYVRINIHIFFLVGRQDGG